MSMLFDLPTFWRLEEKTAWKAGYKKTYIQGQCHTKTLLQIIIWKNIKTDIQ